MSNKIIFIRLRYHSESLIKLLIIINHILKNIIRLAHHIKYENHKTKIRFFFLRLYKILLMRTQAIYRHYSDRSTTTHIEPYKT